jgi:hypothetical protein
VPSALAFLPMMLAGWVNHRTASASNKPSAFVVEPEGANEPSARHQMEKAPMGPFSFGGDGSLKRTRLQCKSLLTGKNTGKIRISEDLICARFRRNPYPEPISSHPFHS